MAKNKTTVPTYTYVVYTDSNCTVTDSATGRELLTAYPGMPNYFTATGDSVTLSEDSATILKPVFKCAPDALGLLVGGYKLPAGYTRLEYLEGDYKAYIKTDYFPEVGCEIWCTQKIKTTSQATFGAGSSYPNLVVLVYDAGTRNGYMAFFNDMPAVTLPWTFEKHTMHFSPDGTITDGKNSTRVEFAGTKTANPLYLFTRADKLTTPSNCQIYSLKIKHTRSIDLIPAIDPTGAPCMFDMVSCQPFKNAGSGQFVAGVGSVAQLRSILRKLPATGGALTLSLPAEANTPEIADMLTAAAAENGWTLTVHEYRPAEAATYSLRRVRQVLWCRTIPDTLGNYVNASGNRVHLESCVAIFGPLGSDPNAYGFDPYDSLDHATESLGLTPYLPENNTETE